KQIGAISEVFLQPGATEANALDERTDDRDQLFECADDPRPDTLQDILTLLSTRCCFIFSFRFTIVGFKRRDDGHKAVANTYSVEQGVYTKHVCLERSVRDFVLKIGRAHV